MNENGYTAVQIFIVLFFLGYYVYLVKRYGGTPGKRLLGLNIEPVLNAIWIATLAWILSEFIELLTNKEKRGLQDYIAQTVVIKVKRCKNKAPEISPTAIQ